MRFVIAGASGFLGTAWRDHLAQRGHEVVRLVRGAPMSGSESRWDPYAGQVDDAVIESADVVACLSGAPLAHLPWTASYRQTFAQSRLATTRTLAEAIAASERKPAFVAQNGISGYGDRKDLVITEDSETDAATFMGRLTREWEQATHPARDAGARVVVLRTSVVLGRRGGAFKAMLPLFKAGLGGTIGSGQQYFATISVRDWVRAVTFLATHDDCSGPYNLTGPDPATNAEFTEQLGELLNRPTRLRAPSFAIRAALGETSSELLGSVRLEPARLLAAGFTFDDPTVRDQLAAALH
jgi:uncharacterized protein